jgi:cysteine desulfurase family protein
MIYLNNAATSFPKPQNVIDAVNNFIQNPPPSHGRGSSHGPDPVDLCRKEIAKFLNADQPEQIIFTSGATESLNLILKGMDLAGKHVLTTCTEHNSVIRPLTHLNQDQQTEAEYVACDQFGKIDIQHLERRIRENTALILVNHISNVTGTIQDIDGIAQIAHSHKIPFVIDASQSIGLIKLDIKKLQPSAIVFTGHKGLYSLQGIGALWVSPELHLKPLKTGGTGTRSMVLHQPDIMPMRYEAGTKNMVGIVSLLEGLKFVKKHGCKKMLSHKRDLISILLEKIKGNKNITTYIPRGNIPTVLSFKVKNLSNKDVIFILEESFGIIARNGLHCAPIIHQYLGTEDGGTVRLSPSFFTTHDEIEQSAKALLNIADMGEML